MNLTSEAIENICDRYLPKKYKLWYPDEGMPYLIENDIRIDIRDGPVRFNRMIKNLCIFNYDTITKLEDLILNNLNEISEIVLKEEIRYKQYLDFLNSKICYPILYRKIMTERFNKKIYCSHYNLIWLFIERSYK